MAAREEQCKPRASRTRLLWRVARRVVLLVLWTLPLVSLHLAAMLIGLLFPPLVRGSRRLLFRLWGRGVLRILGGRVEVEGEPPKPPCVIVANHLSYVDIFVMASQTGATFVSKSDVAKWPFIGPLAKVVNTIFIDRTRIRDTVRVNRQIGRALDQGRSILIFAESRISQGQDVQPFKSPLLEPAAKLRLPVHYAAITYVTPSGYPPPSERILWLAGLSFMEHFARLMQLPGFTARVTFGDRPIEQDDRKRLAEQLWREVQRRYVPVE